MEHVGSGRQFSHQLLMGVEVGEGVRLEVGEAAGVGEAVTVGAEVGVGRGDSVVGVGSGEVP